MIPCILPQRQHKTNATTPFNDLVAYIEENKGQEKRYALSNKFSDILNYSTAFIDKTSNKEKCIAIRTHGVADIATASIEMNAVAVNNTRCKDPAYHFILSWPEHEHPDPNSIFDAAEHAINALGLSEHQYVIAVHGNTDNIHCHVAVSRIHPDTYRSHNIEWAKKSLHMAARQSEIRHGWTHDNGIYIVSIDDNNKKTIVLNPNHDHTIPHAHRDLENEILPTWHDPESLESWLKRGVAKRLKRDLPELNDWEALHTWLSQHGITLTDTGGGGMRLHAISPETNEIVNLPTSKGLRILKRADLESRWGKFADAKPMSCIVPDLSHLTHRQLTKGVNHVLTRSLDHGIPPAHIINANANRLRDRFLEGESLHDVSFVGLDADRQNGALIPPNVLQDRLEHQRITQDPTLRHSETGESGSRSLTRDNARREERKNQRAAARADLRQRFSQYKRFVHLGNPAYFKRMKEFQADRSLALKTIRQEIKAAKFDICKNRTRPLTERLLAIIAIDFESTRQKLQVEAAFQEKTRSLRATRLPPLSWRIWLLEQSNLGDQAAVSALRGIVYQEQCDGKLSNTMDVDNETQATTSKTREQQYCKAMARLHDQEKNEIAIRSARSDVMRPYEADALLARYTGIQWRVTGNGNIEYSDHGGQHLFTDRGNRVTFDRVRVTDEEICLALIHAQNKFGKQLTLTGNDRAFSERMASLADDMGMTILNPELQPAIKNHRIACTLQINQVVLPIPDATMSDKQAKAQTNHSEQKEPLPQQPDHPGKKEIQLQEPVSQTMHERLQAMVLAIDPRAKFETPVADDHGLYIGPVAASLNPRDDAAQGFAQHVGRGVYVLHPINAPDNHDNATVEVQYRNGLAIVSIPERQKEKGLSS